MLDEKYKSANQEEINTSRSNSLFSVLIAAKHFIRQGNNVKAKALLAEIPKSKCEQACLIEKEKISKGYSPYRVISEHSKFESEEVINYQSDFFEKIAFLIVTLFIAATIFQRMRKI